ncbi:MAG TPA: hypothetical protein VFK05_20390 [Polyangiaceae bacterium]|nr:hypothetical protein [Polyangiaceae bacterium]
MNDRASFKTRVRLAALLSATVVIGFAFPGCVTPSSTLCTDGRICPPGNRCDDVNHRCLGATYCGDGERAGTEDCEGSDLGGQTCKSLGFYGETTGLKCSSDCTFDKSGCSGRCGDGVIQGPDEQCDGEPPAGKSCLDFGYDSGFLGCSELCQPSVAGCENIGWKVVTPAGYNAIWGSAADDVYAVGKDIIHWDGRTWSAMNAPPAPTTTAEYAKGGTGPSSPHPPTNGGTPPMTEPTPVYGSGECGESCPTAASPSGWVSVWGSGPRDVWVVGGAQIVHWDGAAWSTPPMPALDHVQPGWRFGGLWGSGPHDVYAFGVWTDPPRAPDPAVQLFHWDGANWSSALLPIRTDDWVQAIGGSGPNDVYVLTGGGLHLHGDGTSWSPIQIGTTDRAQRIWASAPNDVYAVGAETMHWDGSSWARLPGAPYGLSVWGSGPRDVFISSSDSISHWDGADWSKIYQAANDEGAGGIGPMPPVATVWGAGSLESTWILREDGIARVNRGLWFDAPDAPQGAALWGTGEDVFVLSYDVFRHLRKGSAPTTLSPIVLTGGNAFGLWGSAVDDVWAWGYDHNDNGYYGAVYRWNGSDWNVVKTVDGGLPSALGGSSSSDVWVLNGPAFGGVQTLSGTAMHWDGQRWSEPVDLGSFGGPFFSIWSRSSTEAFAVGSSGTIIRWDGTAWSSMTSGTTENLADVWGTGRDVFVVGTHGTILRLVDGTRWTAMASGTTSDLSQIRGSGDGNVFAVGADRLLHLRAGAWEPIEAWDPNESVPGGAFWVTPTSVYFSGSRLDLLGVNCQSPETSCTDGWDNDCDGLQDGADPDCNGQVVEQCANLVDDDSDGLLDCQDPDCAAFSRCRRP